MPRLPEARRRVKARPGGKGLRPAVIRIYPRITLVYLQEWCRKMQDCFLIRDQKQTSIFKGVKKKRIILENGSAENLPCLMMQGCIRKQSNLCFISEELCKCGVMRQSIERCIDASCLIGFPAALLNSGPSAATTKSVDTPN